MVSEFASSLNRETDFGREARSVVLFRTALADVPDLWIPGVVAECSGGAVLTLEFSAGERIDHYAKLHPEAMPRVDEHPGTADAAIDLRRRACFTPIRIPAMCSSCPMGGFPCSISAIRASLTSRCANR